MSTQLSFDLTVYPSIQSSNLGKALVVKIIKLVAYRLFPLYIQANTMVFILSGDERTVTGLKSNMMKISRRSISCRDSHE